MSKSIIFLAAIFHLSFAPLFAAPIAPASAPNFSMISPSDPLFAHLQIVRSAGWTSISSAPAQSPTGSTPGAGVTRYEIALETTKALIAVRARSGADANWKQNVSLSSLKALRALCVALKSELARFEMDVPASLKLLDSLMKSAKDSPAGSTPGRSNPDARAVRLQNERADNQSGEMNLETIPLSQRLRVYSALDSLAREAHDPLRVAPAPGIKKLRAGASFEVTQNLRVRGDFQKQDAARAPGLREWLGGSNAHYNGRSERSFSGGADWTLRPGVVFSGDVARIDSGDRSRDGMRFEGGVGLSGWQNRVALSAHLSRLVPEDSLALGQTAARLNLGVEVTSQVQLKLMYEQMFGAQNAGRGARFGGGIDFSF